jgi:hypothetical protein
MTARNKDEMINSLMDNTPQEILANNDIRDNVSTDAEDDYEFVRATLKSLIKKSNDSIETMALMASDSEHPRAFEVLSTMIKNTSDIAGELMDNQKKRRDLLDRDGLSSGSNQDGSVTNNAIFVGSTTELQKFLKNETIDI